MNKLVPVLLIAFSFFALLSSSQVQASSHAAPEVDALGGSCNRSILTTDDLFCALSYELPTQVTATPGTPEAWCAELDDTSGCTDDPVRATVETSLPAGRARISLYDGCTTDCLSASLITTREAPRVWFGISGVYVEDASSITWGDSDIEICIESVIGAFTTQEQDCNKPNWSTASNTQSAQRDSMGANMVADLINLESDRNLPDNFLVSANKITAEGVVYTKEAFTFAPAILDVYQTNITTTNQEAFAAQTDQLRLDILATATAITGSYEAIGAIISPTGGPEIGGLILFGTLGVITFFLIYRFTREFIWPSIGFATWGLFGALAGGVDTQVIFIFVLLMSLSAMVFIMRRIGWST